MLGIEEVDSVSHIPDIADIVHLDSPGATAFAAKESTVFMPDLVIPLQRLGAYPHENMLTVRYKDFEESDGQVSTLTKTDVRGPKFT